METEKGLQDVSGVPVTECRLSPDEVVAPQTGSVGARLHPGLPRAAPPDSASAIPRGRRSSLWPGELPPSPRPCTS